MLSFFARLGVKWTLLLAIGASTLLAGGFTAWTINRVVLGALEEALLHRGESDARVLASELAAGLSGGGPGPIAAALEERFDETQDAYVVVVRSDGSIAAKRFARGADDNFEEVRQAHQAAGMAPFFRAGGLLRFTAPVMVTLGRSDGSHEDKVIGHVLLGLTSTRLNQRLGEVRLLVLSLLAVGGLALGAMVYFFIARLVLARLDQMSAVARRMSD